MSSALRIALLLPGLPANEEDPCIPVITTFIREMAERVNLTVFTGEYPYRPGTYSLFGAIAHCGGERPRNRLDKIIAWNRIRRRIHLEHRMRKFDLLHAFWATVPGFVGVQTARRLGLPALVSLAGGELAEQKEASYGAQLFPLSKQLVSHTIAGATALTAGSDWLAQKVPTRFQEKLRVLPLGLDTTRFQLCAQRGGAKLLAVAALIPVKDYPTLLHAVAHARRERPDLELTVAGWKGNREELRRIEGLKEELGISEAVTILGEVHHHQIMNLYAEHSLFVHSSLYEAQGMAILEALATGMPVVSTEVGIVASLPDQLVYRCTARQPEEMAQQIVRSLETPCHAEKAYHQGPQLIGDRFDASNVVEKFIEHYQEIIHERISNEGTM